MEKSEGGWHREVLAGAALMEAIGKHQYGRYTLGQLASNNPEVLLGSCTKKTAGLDGPVIAAYLATLRSCRKMFESAKAAGWPELLQSIHTAGSMSDAIPLAGAPDASSSHQPPGAIVPAVPKIIPLAKLEQPPLRCFDRAAAIREPPSSTAAVWASKVLPTDVVDFYAQHLGVMYRTALFFIKYCPIVLAYGSFVWGFIALMTMVNNPEFAIDVCFWILEMVPTYVSYTLRRIMTRASQRLSIAVLRLDNGTLGFTGNEMEVAPYNSLVSLAVLIFAFYFNRK